jgi:hypothetical protein
MPELDLAAVDEMELLAGGADNTVLPRNVARSLPIEWQAYVDGVSPERVKALVAALREAQERISALEQGIRNVGVYSGFGYLQCWCDEGDPDEPNERHSEGCLDMRVLLAAPAAGPAPEVR